MISDPCPACQNTYEWDPSMDTYTDSDEITFKSPYDDEHREVSIYYCSCGTAFAILFKDDNGASIFVPSEKEL